MSKKVLPKLESPPATILEHLIAEFPHVNASTWRSRFARGLVTLSDGVALTESSPYRHGVTVCYRREVPDEPSISSEERILYEDSDILVVDKPHGMTVTPAGEYVERALLTRLQKSTGRTTLAPAHRLDRDTAGIVLFVANPTARAAYHRLFSTEMVQREYLAIAQIPSNLSQKRWLLASRIERGNPWHTQAIVEGTPNATTEINLLDVQGTLGLFQLLPRTGKKHQLRLHMASLGFPIVGDPLYGLSEDASASADPLQLLARRLAFCDPRDGALRAFTSARTLGLMSNFKIPPE